MVCRAPNVRRGAAVNETAKEEISPLPAGTKEIGDPKRPADCYRSNHMVAARAAEAAVAASAGLSAPAASQRVSSRAAVAGGRQQRNADRDISEHKPLPQL